MGEMPWEWRLYLLVASRSSESTDEGEGGEAYASSVHTAKFELGATSESSDELARLYRRRSG